MQPLYRTASRGLALSPILPFILAAPFGSAPSLAQSDPGAAPLTCPDRPDEGALAQDPPVLRSERGLLKATLSFRVSRDAGGRVHYCYVGPDGKEAPTLRLSPGDRLALTLRNDAPGFARHDMPAMQMSLNGCTGAGMNALSTNLHFHGLALPPKCHQDEVLTTFVTPGGQPFQYRITIPSDAAPGLYWYHPHVHGVSSVQALGGASGALIVEDPRAHASIGDQPERVFVIRDQELLHPDAQPKATDSMPAPLVMRDAEGDILNTGGDGGTPARDLTLNFVPVSFPDYRPAMVRVPPQQRQLWRILNASAVTYLDLQLLFGDRIQALGVVATDGVPLNFEQPDRPAILWQSHAQLAPGSRVDVMVMTPAIGERAHLVTRRVDTGPVGENDPTRPLATVVADASVRSIAALMPGPAPSRVPARPWLGTVEPVRTRRLYFYEQPRDPNDPGGLIDFSITPQGEEPRPFDPTDMTPSIVVHAGDVEDWIIENRTRELHAFHIHQIHFMLMEWNGIPVDEPYLRDIVNVSYWDGQSAQYPAVRLRMDFRDPNIVGTFVYHCHLLDHEDGGMMGLIQVLPRQAR